MDVLPIVESDIPTRTLADFTVTLHAEPPTAGAKAAALLDNDIASPLVGDETTVLIPAGALPRGLHTVAPAILTPDGELHFNPTYLAFCFLAGPPDTVPPSNLRILSATKRAASGGFYVTVLAEAFDDVAVAGIELHYKAKLLAAQGGNQMPVRCYFFTRILPRTGPIPLTFSAYDAEGNVSTKAFTV